MHELDRIISAIKFTERGFVATVVRTQGSTYRRPGARSVITDRGDVTGTISGGCLERDLAARSAQWMRDMKPCLVTYDSSREDDIVFGLGLGCRGIIDVHIEPFDAAHPSRLVTEFAWNGRETVTWTTSLDGHTLLVEMIQPQRALAIFGGGPDVDPVARIAESIGWSTRVVAPRDVHPEQVAQQIDLRAFDAAVVMTHNYLYDLELLRTLFATDIAYLGLLGPKSRGDELLAEVGNADRDRLHYPIGLDLGGDTPEEIALAIVAEIQAVVHRRNAQPLRDSDRPLHVPPDTVILSAEEREGSQPSQAEILRRLRGSE
jgi:xanthine/CO dehydrogenase XdhC/CoxF family maturation factor